MVGRSQEDQFAQILRPPVVGTAAIVIGAACHQTSHTMSDNCQLCYCDRPFLHQRIDQGSKLPSIMGDMSPRVVVQIYGRVSQVAG